MENKTREIAQTIVLDDTNTNGHGGWAIFDPANYGYHLATIYADVVTVPRPPREQVLTENAHSLEFGCALVERYNSHSRLTADLRIAGKALKDLITVYAATLIVKGQSIDLINVDPFIAKARAAIAKIEGRK